MLHPETLKQVTSRRNSRKRLLGRWWHLSWTLLVEVLRHNPPQASYPHHWNQEGTQHPQLSFSAGMRIRRDPQTPIPIYTQHSSLLLQRALNLGLTSLHPLLMCKELWRHISPLTTHTHLSQKNSLHSLFCPFPHHCHSSNLSSTVPRQNPLYP